MSRPFSYNDENFTVIGNLLFCHIRITKEIPATKAIVELPSAIATRLIYSSCQMMGVTSDLNTPLSAMYSIGLKYDSATNKYVFYAPVAVSDVRDYLVGFYLLKDI